MAFTLKKYQFDKKTEELLFKKAVPNIVHDGAQFEGLPITLLQTEQIINNEPINGLTAKDILVVHDMHKGADFVLQNYATFNFDKLKQLHETTGRDDTINPGQLRTGRGGVQTKKGTFIPDPVNEKEAKTTVNYLLATDELTPETKATKLFTYLSRAQLFNDTNKRTAVLAANVPLLKAGAGVFYIPEPAMENTLGLMNDYYWSNDDRLLNEVLENIAVSDYDGKTFYDPEHQYYDYSDEHQKHLNQFKGLNAKGLLGKERYQELTQPLVSEQERVDPKL
ncbi:Fic family protein [Weissella halotolerans]|nr:Fic family protein [Weissella halotolerans]